jgi:hypothetical protein
MRKQVTLADGRREEYDVVFKRKQSDCRETRLREKDDTLRIESTYLLTTFSRLKPETDIIATYL